MFDFLIDMMPKDDYNNNCLRRNMAPMLQGGFVNNQPPQLGFPMLSTDRLFDQGLNNEQSGIQNIHPLGMVAGNNNLSMQQLNQVRGGLIGGQMQQGQIQMPMSGNFARGAGVGKPHQK